MPEAGERETIFTLTRQGEVKQSDVTVLFAGDLPGFMLSMPVVTWMFNGEPDTVTVHVPRTQAEDTPTTHERIRLADQPDTRALDWGEVTLGRSLLVGGGSFLSEREQLPPGPQQCEMVSSVSGKRCLLLAGHRAYSPKRFHKFYREVEE